MLADLSLFRAYASHCISSVPQINLVTQKIFFGVNHQVRLKSACSVTEASNGLEILAIEFRFITFYRQRTR